MSMPVQARAGSQSFAPAITPEKLSDYKKLVKTAPPEIADAMGDLIKMVEVFRETPESKIKGKPLPEGPFTAIAGPLSGKEFTATEIPLEPEEVKRIDNVVPWPYQIHAMHLLAKTTTGELRNAFYHLIWYATELSKDREPITQEKLEIIG